MKSNILVLILIFWSSTYADETSATLKKVQTGIEAGKAILDVLHSSNCESISKLATISGKIAPFLGAIGPAFALISVFLPNPQITYMKKEFRQLNSKLDRVFHEFGEVKELIEESSLKQQYVPYEHTILSLSSKLQDYVNSSPEDAQTFKKIFVSEYKNSFKDAAQRLFNGMMNKGSVFSLDIPHAAMNLTKYHRRRTQNIMKGTLNLIIQGVKVTLAYYQATDTSDDGYTALSKVWETKIKSLIERMSKKDIEVKNAWHEQLNKDVDSSLQQYSGWDNEDFSEKLYDFLEDKYDWRYWFVVAYDPVSGWEKHCMRYCGGLHRFRQNGRNVMVASVPKTKQAVSPSTTKSRISLKNLSYRRHGYWGANIEFSYGAREIFEKQDKALHELCSPYASIGVIKDRAGPYAIGASGRVVYGYGGEATIFSFS